MDTEKSRLHMAAESLHQAAVDTLHQAHQAQVTSQETARAAATEPTPMTHSIMASWLMHRDHLEELAGHILTRAEDEADYPVKTALEDLDRVWNALIHHHLWLTDNQNPLSPTTHPITILKAAPEKATPEVTK